MRAHSAFPASSAARLIACPGSYGLVETLAETGRAVDRPSIYAAQGSVAHKLAEELLAHRGDKAAQDRLLADTLDFQKDFDGHLVTVDADFLDHVLTYVHYIETLEAFDYELHFEARVSPTLPWAGDQPPIDLFGTSDCWGTHRTKGDIVVLDLKFGSGVKVDVFENPQLLYYALGVISSLPNDTPLDTPVELVVIQPRVIGGHEPKLWNTTVGEIAAWGEIVLKPAVEACLDPFSILVAGAHCKFCPAKFICPELEHIALAKTRELFSFDAKTLLPDTLAKDLLLAEPLEMWIEALREEALYRLERNEQVPGFKLVAKRAIRKWTDPEAAVKLAEDYGENIVTGIMSPAQAEKAVPHVDFKPYYDKQSSGNTIAHTDDPRPEVTPTPSTLRDDLKGSLK